MKFVSLHSHSTFCDVERKALGRPPLPWCERFYPKVFIGMEFECWPWIPTLKSLIEGKNRYFASFNFTISISGYPRQMNPARWIWIAEVGPIPDGYDIDHKCETFYCLNLSHMQVVPSLDNQGKFNVERGVYAHRNRNALGHYTKEVI